MRNAEPCTTWKIQAHYNKSTGGSVHSYKDIFIWFLLINSYHEIKTSYNIDIVLCNACLIWSQIPFIYILVDWSLRSIMNSKLAIRESESHRSAASSIMISQMTSSSVIIPYVIEWEGKLEGRMMNFIRYLQHICFSCIDFSITLNYIYFVWNYSNKS